MEDELLTKPLLVKQKPDNISNSNDHGDSSGAGAAVRPNDSSATVILVISTFVVACSTFTGGCVYIHHLLSLESLLIGPHCSRVLFVWINNDNWSIDRGTSKWDDNRSHWSYMYILDCGYILHHGVAGNNLLQGFMSCLSHHPPSLLQDF
ncbi:hypothetical protein ACB092_03G064100 [Castanea dentata]